MPSHRKPRRCVPGRLAGGLVHLARACGLVTRPAAQHTSHRRLPAADPAPPATAAPATLDNPIVPETCDDIDPARQPAELAAGGSVAAERAVNKFHSGPARIPPELVTWTFLEDGAHGVVSQDLTVSDQVRRGVVAAVAATLGVRTQERDRSDGYAAVSAAGAHPDYPGVRIAVEATCCRDVEVQLAVFEDAVKDLAGDWPDGTEAAPEPARAPIPVPAGRHPLTLRAPRQAT